MDRQVLDFAAASAMAYAQQQRQTSANMQQPQPFGFRPQHQQFPPSVHGPPFLPPHPSMQQFPFHQPLQQLHPHHPPHPHLLHFQQQQQAPPSFPPHLPSSVSPPFHGLYDSAPPPLVPPLPIPPPSDPELQKRIDKLVEYSLKNGPEFEAMIREKQQDNPAYSFLFGGEGHGYYRYKLWLTSHSPPGGVFNSSFPPSSISMMHASSNTLINPSPMNAPAAPALGVPPMHQFAQFYEQQPHHQHAFGAHGQADYDQSLNSFKGLSGPLPSDVASELNNVLSNLTGAKESIKGAKAWFMQRSPFAPALAEALRDRIFAIDDSDRQLHIIYLVNDILFESLPRRTKTHELDNEALAFKPVLGPMLARVYHNPNIKEENQSKLQTLVQFWLSREIYDQDTITAFEGEIMNGPPVNSFTGIPKDFSTSGDSAAGLPLYAKNRDAPHWQPDRQTSVPGLSAQEHPHPDKHVIPGQAIPPSVPLQPFLPNSAAAGVYAAGPMPIPSSIQLANQQAAPILLLPQTTQLSEKLPPYPLFPPGLIPGMVRKMQIGSGVPYSPMSPLDIPTVIPPSDITPSEVLERVSKFFKEIGEVNPSEGPMDSDLRDEDKYYDRDSPVRKGGACIPPPSNLQVDPETGTYADGSVDRKSGSGRLGLGASANPNEVSQYDDVYSSYRKQRSTNYHSSMSARTVTR